MISFGCLNVKWNKPEPNENLKYEWCPELLEKDTINDINEEPKEIIILNKKEDVIHTKNKTRKWISR